MGTRNLSICKINNEYKIFQYGQWDGQPSGQGSTILSFCKSKENLDKLKDLILNKVEFYNDNPEISKKADELLQLKDGIMTNYFEKINSRDVCGYIFDALIEFDENLKEPLPEIFEGKYYLKKYDNDDEKLTENYLNLWIEWSYLINFDTNQLECYGGIEVKKYNLDNLPTEKQFIEDLETYEEEDYDE